MSPQRHNRIVNARQRGHFLIELILQEYADRLHNLRRLSRIWIKFIAEDEGHAVTWTCVNGKYSLVLRGDLINVDKFGIYRLKEHRWCW